ncbi:pseudouridine synthase [Pseudohongiella nitratireducens]|uniref:Pseudouridine synthase n=1 Tax=Pseudohongiella nitratireducens TaxID=1768907 RepID=A0A916QMA6_9GAMM|nr:RluA family pseudouridine synthase [Pseudohongiella nitratireducens]GFZ82401.1 pseudouridine synthase [Pseudohongiella nitratireducens]
MNHTDNKTGMEKVQPGADGENRPRVRFFDVDENSHGQRLDNFLASRLKGVPKSLIYRYIRKDEIRINKKRCKQDTRLTAGDQVRVAPIRISTQQATAAPGAELQAALRSAIVYEDECLIAINKPAGLAVHAGTGSPRGLIESLRHMGGEGSYRELVHRLDKETSGLMLIAKQAKALKKLQDDFRARRVTKVYQALVHGHWPATLNRIDKPLSRRQPTEGERIVVVDKAGKPAETAFRLLKLAGRNSLIEARPKTGRTHQIRVHCQQAGHAIIGDSKYTPAGQSQAEGKELFLHAASLQFTHPLSSEQMTLNAELRPSMSRFIQRYCRT